MYDLVIKNGRIKEQSWVGGGLGSYLKLTPPTASPILYRGLDRVGQLVGR